MFPKIAFSLVHCVTRKIPIKKCHTKFHPNFRSEEFPEIFNICKVFFKWLKMSKPPISSKVYQRNL